MKQVILANSYFDGIVHHTDGPYAIHLAEGKIATIVPTREASPSVNEGTSLHRAKFAMPGLVEAHAHIFLDGGELDLSARSAYLKAPFDAMMDVGRRNLASSLRQGVTLIRDAGDKYGVNHALRAEVRQGKAVVPDLRSPGLGIRRPSRYGGFMAYEATDDKEILAAVDRIVEEGADDLKLILTGIIDFATGQVKGEPQFDERALSLAIKAARGYGLKTFAHCSGLLGLEVAVAAGVDSVEHGFFMDRDILARMADKGTAWVPTFSPVHFQWARPEIVGWDEAAVGHLREILDDHLKHVALAHEMGVNLVAGSDAGSHGVSHGPALLDELFFFLDAGMPMAAVLESATSRPRRLWGMEGDRLCPGAPADVVLLNGDPFENSKCLREVDTVFKNGKAAVFSIEEERVHA